MMLPSFDPAAFAAQIEREWDAVAADWGDRRLWSHVERAAQGLNDRLVELAGIAPGQRVLDVGTGIGEPAVTAARRVGPTGRVLGIDLAQRMVEVGRLRVASLELPQVELACGDVTTFELEEDAFDAVLSRWVLMLVPDLPAALGRLLGALVPGGRLAVAFWGHPRRVPMIQSAFDALASLVDLPPPPSGVPSHLWAAGLEAMADLATEAGFTDVETETFSTVFEFPSAAAYAEFIGRIAGPVKLLLGQHAGLEAAFAEALAERASAFIGPCGTVRLANENLLLAGRRP